MEFWRKWPLNWILENKLLRKRNVKWNEVGNPDGENITCKGEKFVRIWQCFTNWDFGVEIWVFILFLLLFTEILEVLIFIHYKDRQRYMWVSIVLYTKEGKVSDWKCDLEIILPCLCECCLRILLSFISHPWPSLFCWISYISVHNHSVCINIHQAKM